MLLRIYIILLYFRMLLPTSENKEKAAQKVGFFFVQSADFKPFRSEIALRSILYRGFLQKSSCHAPQMRI